MNERFDRQLMMFGRSGQNRLRELTVAVVGLGGIGSHVVQQLAYLGVRNFLLLDHDKVEESNLNRLIGAGEADVDARNSKTAVAQRLIESIDSTASVTALGESFVSEHGSRCLQDVHAVFGCVDSDAVRLALNEICQAYELTYFDSATDIFAHEGITFGGRVLTSHNGEGCVVCMQLLDADAVREGLLTDEQRATDAAIYGVNRSVLGRSGPSVVSLNGIIASIAVTEFMVWATGIRRPVRLLEYHGMRGVVSESRDQAPTDCYYCRGVRGSRRLDLSQYAALL